ncbi:MAG: hypothetical protein E7139_00975 [Rikenellaceae bacterium]|nr:hypothetical protein [Rikenellaceae bacterium]
MKSRRIILTILCAIISTTLYAQKLSLGYLYPSGGQVGTTVEIEAGGLNINKATKVLFSHEGISAEIEPVKESAAKKRKRRRLNDQSSPQLADRVKLRITIAADVPCGMYDLRLQGVSGVSNMLPFEVASYPNFVENNRASQRNPNRVTALPAVLCGYVTPGGVDYFNFEGEKGQTIVATVKARQMVPYIADAVPGWFQPVLKIVDSEGREVAYSDDYHHNVDPVIITTLPKNDNYTVIIHDAIYRGREDFNYRIHLGVIPFVTGRYPAYGTVGKSVKQQLEGVNLGATTAKIKVKKAGYNSLTFTNDIGTSDAVSFYALPKGVKHIQTPKEGAVLNVESAISDSLTSTAKVKRYIINAQMREPIIVELIGRRNGSRIDAVMRFKDCYGKVVAKKDDTEDPLQGMMTFHADPVLKYTPKRSEVLILEVEDLYQGYGADYHYLLWRHRQMPTFNAFVAPANITVPAGGTATFRVDITGKVKRPANLIVEGLPAGFTTSSLNIRGSKRWNVSITAPKDAEVERFPIEVKLEYPTPDGREQANVVPVDNMMQAFYYTHHIQASELALDVVQPSPYRMSVDFDVANELPFAYANEHIPIKIIVDKEPGFNEPIEIVMGVKHRIFSLEPVTILPEETEKIIYLKLNHTALERFRGRKNPPSWQMNIVGTVKGEITKQGKRTFQNAKYREITPYFVLKLAR